MCVMLPSILLTSTVLAMVTARFCGRERFGDLKIVRAFAFAFAAMITRDICNVRQLSRLDDKGVKKWLNNGWLG